MKGSYKIEEFWLNEKVEIYYHKVRETFLTSTMLMLVWESCGNRIIADRFVSFSMAV